VVVGGVRLAVGGRARSGGGGGRAALRGHGGWSGEWELGFGGLNLVAARFARRCRHCRCRCRGRASGHNSQTPLASYINGPR
jgi:hypothetical protein